MELNTLEKGAFDKEHKALKRFILEGKQHLSKNGSLYVGFSKSGSDFELIKGWIEKAGWKKEVVYEEVFNPKIYEGKKGGIHVLLYRLY